MGCLFYIILLPIYIFVFVFGICFYFIYFLFSMIIYGINKLIFIFTKREYDVNKPNFNFERVIVSNNYNFKKAKDNNKKGKVIDAIIEEE